MYKFTGESKLDVCADIAAPFFEIIADPEIQKLKAEGAPIVQYVKPAIKNHRKEVIEVLARVQSEEGVSPEEYLEQVGVLTIPVEFLGLLSNPEMTGLFNSQSQSKDATSSGSATGNTEVKRK